MDQDKKYWDDIIAAHQELTLRERLDQAREVAKLADEYINAYRRTTNYELFCQTWNVCFPHLAPPPVEDYIRVATIVFRTFATGLTLEISALEHQAKKQEKECLAEELKKDAKTIIYL